LGFGIWDSIWISHGMRLAIPRRMAKITSYKDLKVWQLGMDLVDVCFDIVEALPVQYRFTFSNQLLPAGMSIPSNIAEGSRRPRRAYLNHLSYSLGSQAEVETILEVIARRKLVPMPLLTKATELAETVGQMLHGLVRSLEQ
jgi:four helix bundle protein